jgi:asparagine synthase (glutamine-hydrolysing)
VAAIAGVVAPFKWTPAPLLEGMARRLSHHPRTRVESWHGDHGGLCHVRSLPDRSARQPVFNARGDLCLVMAGECYGYDAHRRELASAGHVFGRGHADAEYCLALYEAVGVEGFARLNGSFCLAIFDAANKEVLIVSDRLGSRPLFHGTAADGTFAFATQVSAVASHPGIARELEIDAVIEFCMLQRVLGTKTYHKGVSMLPPASVLRFSGGGASISSYWALKYQPQPGTKDEYADELAATIRKAVRRITEGGLRGGVLLSGGLDARMIVAAADEPLTCFTFGDYENPESQVARQVAAAKGYPFRFLQRTPDQYADMVDPGVEIGSGMHPFNHAHALGFLDAIGQECDVLTHGYGIEILFRGTSLPKTSRRFLGVELSKSVDRTLDEASLPGRLFQRGYNLVGRGMRDLLAPVARIRVDDVLRGAAQTVLRSAEGHVSNVFDRFLWPDVYFRGRFPSFLFELSLRPFVVERSIDFDNDILALHQRMPVEVRSDQEVWIKAMARLSPDVAGVVNANTGYSPLMSSRKLAAAKLRTALIGALPGSGARVRSTISPPPGMSPHSWPRFDWMIRNNARLRTMITETLSDPEALPPSIFQLDRISELLAEHLATRGHHRDVLFALLTFGRWHKKYGAH